MFILYPDFEKQQALKNPSSGFHQTLCIFITSLKYQFETRVLLNIFTKQKSS